MAMDLFFKPKRSANPMRRFVMIEAMRLMVA
jgi:hypothetical protein